MQIIQGQCKRVSKPVEKDQDISSLAHEVMKVCYMPMGTYPYAYAVAHCQVDHDNPLRFFVMNDGATFVNPRILEKSESFTHKEGCYSYSFRPEKKVKRFAKVTVQYWRDGKEIIEECSGLRACIFQHEIDHMNGRAIYS